MASRIALLIAVCSLGVAQLTLTSQPVNAAARCGASFVVLGQMPALTGATPTDWFNVFGTDFDPSVPPVIAFGTPAIPYSIENPFGVQPAVTTFTVPAQAFDASFKWTFRSRDVSVKTISVAIAGKGCTATTVIDLAPPPSTSTEEPRDVGGTGPFPRPGLFVLAFAAGMIVTTQRLRRWSQSRG